MTALPAPDLFAEIFAPGDEAGAGLAQLAAGAPLWGTPEEWAELVASLRAFEDRWGSAARLAGWSLVALYGLDPVAPRARVCRMGAAFLACAPGRQVLEVDGEAIRIVTRTAARLRIFKGEAEGAVVAWELRPE